MAKKKAKKQPAGVKISSDQAAEIRSMAKYTVRVVCAECGARTLDCFNSPKVPQRGDELPTSCQKPKSPDENCGGRLIVRNVFSVSKEV